MNSIRGARLGSFLALALLSGCAGSEEPLTDSDATGAGNGGLGGSGGSGGKSTGGGGNQSSAGSGGVSSAAGAGSGGGGASSAGSGGKAAGGSPNVSMGTPGVWENVTPSAISLDQQNPGGGDNYGVQDVLADPARPSDLYAFVCYQGVWRSQDYGVTWTQVNSTVNWGKPWGTAIDPNPNRDPETAPVLFAGGSNAVGIFKSVDFGVTWSVTALPSEFGDYRYQQVYSVDIDPYDNEHLLVAFHEAPDMAESTDGGQNWTKHNTPAEDGGSSYYPFFVNTGDAATTRTTWLTIPQQNGDARALRTENSGQNWTKLGKFQHHHGSAQLFDAGGGTIYVAAMQPSGIHKSVDYGETWNSISELSDGVVTATPNYLYASVGMGWGKVGDPLDPKLALAPRNTDSSWTTMTEANMVDGSKRMAVTFDGTHWVVVAGNWHAGIWRYVEP